MSQAILPVLPGLTWQNTMAPKFSSKIQTSVGQSEVRAAFSPYPVRHYVLTYNFLRGYGAFTELQQLYGFFCARLGSFDSFLYDDPEDDTVPDTSPGNFGTGDGSTTQFQLGRSRGGFFEPVYNLHSTPKIYVNGILKTVSTDYSISGGLVTFTAAPGNGLALTWSGTYYWRCRFEDDMIDFTEFASLYWEQRKLGFRTILNG
jgi:uncharacterized protein (TIGR02217 family)